MLSDGFCIVPLLNDLAHLVAAGEGFEGVRPLPSLPNVFDCLEARLLRTIMGDNSRRDTITREELVPKRFEGKKRYVTLLPELVTAIRRAAECLTVTPEIVILTAITISSA
eukprot:5687173-Amphidinium_carterae.1